MPYMDVVRRFAQITGKPLIADVTLDGTLTFFDPKPYEYGEALDTLNLILAGKQAMLVETGRYLRLIPFDDLQKLPLPIYRGLEDAGDTRPGEIVTVVLQLQNLDAAEISESITPMLSKAGSVAPLSRGRGLIITDRVENIRRVRELLAQIDASAPKQRQMKIHPLRNASGPLLADLINRTFGVATAPKRTVFNQARKSWDVLPPDPEDYVTAVYAQASNTLVLFGPAERMAMAEELIQRFETESGARATEVKVFYPQMQAEELARMLREAIPGIASGREGRGETQPRARVIPDPTSNRLVVTAPAAGQMEAIEKLIHQLDPTTQEVPPEEKARAGHEFRIVELQNISADSLVPLLREAFAEQMRSLKGPDYTPRARIMADPTGGRVLLAGSPEEIKEVLQLISRLDAAPGSQSILRVFKLKRASARNLAMMIMAAMGGNGYGRYSSYSYRRSVGFQRPGQPPARAMADERTNSLIVMAPPEQMQLIEDVIQQLEAGEAPAGARLRLVRLEHNSATVVLAMLSQLYAGRLRDPDPSRRVAFTAAPDDRTLAIQGDEASLQEIEAVVKELDLEGAGAGWEIRTYAVPEGRVNDIAASLSRLFAEERGERRASGRPPRFEADAGSDTLIVAAAPTEFPQIEQLLEKLRTAVTSATQLRTIYLKHARAEQVLPVLREMLGEGDASRNWYYYMRYRGGGKPAEFKISVAPALNAIVIQAPPQKLALATQLIRTLDVPDSEAAGTVQLVALQQGDADQIAAAVGEILRPERGRSGEAPAVQVTAVPGARTVLVRGVQAEVERVVGLIKELDAHSGEAGQVTKVYHLQYADAREVVSVLETTLGTGGSSRSYFYYYRYRGGRPSDQEVRVTAAGGGLNAVVVQASPEKQKQVEDLIGLLDVEEASQGGAIQTVQLQQADANEVAQALNQALAPAEGRGRSGAVRVTAVAGARTVLVTGVPREVAEVVTLIQGLDASSGEAGLELKVYRLQHAEAQQVADVLNQALGTGSSLSPYFYFNRYRGGQQQETFRVTAARALNAVVVQTTPAKQKLAAELVKTLDVEQSAEAALVRAVQLEQAQPEAVALAVNNALAPRDWRRGAPTVRATAVSGTRTVLINGPPAEVEKVVELVHNLDRSGAAAGQEARVYPLQHAAAAQVAEVLQTTLGEGAGSSYRRWSPYGYRAVSSSESVSVTAVRELNAVVVQASPSKQAMAAELIQQLDVPAAAGAAQVRAVVLQKAEPAAVAEAVNASLAADERGREPASVRATPVLGTRTVLVKGPPSEVERVVALIHELDQTGRAGGVQTRVYQLQNGDAAELARTLENLLRGMARNQARWAGRYGSATFTVAADQRTNALIVSADEEAFAVVEQLLPLLDRLPERTDRVVQFYWLYSADALDVADKLQAVFSDRPEKDQPLIEPDLFSNSLTVVANPADLVVIEDVINRLDTLGEDNTVQVRLVTLGSIPAEKMTALLTNIYPQMSTGRLHVVDRLPTPAPTSGAHAPTNRVLPPAAPALPPASSPGTSTPGDAVVPGPGRSMPGTSGAAAPATTPHAVTAVGTPSSATANLTATAGQATTPPEAGQAAAGVGDGSEGAVPPPEVFIAFDREANALLLSGPPAELDQIQHIIDSLEGGFEQAETEIRQFVLREADPVAVARALSELFKVPQPVQPQQNRQAPRSENGRPVPLERDRADRREDRSLKPEAGRSQAGRPGQAPALPRVAVVAEPRTRSVLVRANAADMPLLESVIRQLDAPGLSAQLEHRTIRLQYARPAQLLPLVEQIVKQLNEVQPAEPVAVGADTRQRAIVAIGRGPVLERLAAMVQALDAPTEFAEIEMRVVPLKNATAAGLAALLREMLQPAEGGRQLSEEARALLEQVQRLRLTDEQGRPVTLDLTKPVKVIADPPQAGATPGVAQRLVLGSTHDNLVALTGVVQLLDTVPIVEGLTARIIRLKNVDAAVVLQTLETIFRQARGDQVGRQPRRGPDRRGGKPAAGAGSALAQAPSIALDQRNNALILSGLPEAIELAESIIRDLDQEFEAAVTEVRLFPLQHAVPSRLSTALRAVFTEPGGGRGPRGLQEQISRLRLVLGDKAPQLSETAAPRAAVTIQPDDPSGTLIVAARSDLMPLIAEVVRSLDVPPVGGLAEFRIFPLQHADAASLVAILNDLARSRGRARVPAEELPTLSYDDRTNTIIASGSEAALGFVERFVRELDREQTADLQGVKLIPLTNADATAVAASLQRLMDQREGLRRGGGRRGGPPPITQRTIILPDERSNTLLVSAAPEGFALVESLAKQLDQAEPALAGQVRLVPLTHATAQTLAPTLTSLFNQRYQAARSPEMRRQRPVILADPRSNSLLVAAGVEDNRILEELLEKLDREPENPALRITVIGLQVNDATRVAATVQRVFAARLQSLTPPGQQPAPAERVDVQADPLSNALIVTANPANTEAVRELVAQLDSEPAALGGVIQTFTLQHAEVQRVATLLQTLVQQGVYRPGGAVPSGRGGGRGARGGRDALAIAADVPSNTLIVSASPENLLIVKELIQRLDTAEFTDQTDIRIYPLQHARASYLAQVLEQFFRAKRQAEATATRGQRSIPVTITADDRSNALLITGGRESFAAVERMIQQLDTEEAVARTNFQVFALKRATAAKLAQTLQRLFANRPTRAGVAPEPVTVIPDAWANALIIGAADDDMAMIQELVQQLDSETDEAGLQVQVFPLAKADARRVAQTLQSLFRGGPAGAAAAGPGAVFVQVDERLNAVIVSAGEADLKRVAELVQQLDTDQVARVAEIRVFPLQHARANALATILNDVLNTNPRPLGEENPNRQSLLQFIVRQEGGREFVASALKEGVLIVPDPRINALVVSAPVDYMKLLDEIIHHLDTSKPEIAEIRVFNLKNADARQMGLVLTSLFRLEETGPADAAERSVQYTLVKPAEDGQGETTSAGAVINSAEEQALTVTVDLRTNSLLIGGTEHYVALASEIIQTLDASPAQERQTEVYRLRNTRARDIEGPLRSFLQEDLQRMTSILGPAAVGTAQNILEREVSIVAETNSNTLLLSASPRYFEQVHQLIEQLDQPQEQVLIQVLLAEVTLDNTTELGVEWSYVRGGDPSFETGADFSLDSTLQSLGGYYAALSGSDVQVLLRALEEDGRLEILSRPQILTADNMEAVINIGQRVPLITGSQVTPQGGTVNQFNYEDVGVILTVTPRISPDGFVRLDVAPTISALSSSSVQVSPGLEVPIINQRTATTTVTVRSGESVLLGGLIGSTEDTRTRKIPLLGDIPLLGNLFRSKKSKQGRNELLIVLTPQILSKSESVGTTVETGEYSRREILNSDILRQPERDPIQSRILRELRPDEAVYPSRTNTVAPTAAPRPASELVDPLLDP